MRFELVTYLVDGRAQAGLLVAGHVGPITARPGWSVRDLLGVWDEVLPELRAQAAAGAAGAALAEVKLLAPIPDPGAIFCAGANYYDHQKEMLERIARMTGKPVVDAPRAERPWFFLKTPRQCVVGPDATARIPARSRQLDYEAEMAVIIGRPARNVSLDEAMDYVAAYTCANDLSARDLSTQEDRLNTRMYADWVGHKCFDDSLPMGPTLVPAEFVPDPLALGVRLSINGISKQNGNSNAMIHSVAEQIVALSQRLTLMPGDVVCTGTPAGVGAGRGPKGEFLQVGDVVEVEVDGLGLLRTTMVAGE